MFIYDLIIAPIEMIVGWVFYFFMNNSSLAFVITGGS